MNPKEFYQKAQDYLKNMAKTAKIEDIEKYFVPEETYTINNDRATIENIFERLVVSLQNRNMMPSVIQFNKRRNFIKKALYGFSPHKIYQNYKEDARKLYKVFQENDASLPAKPSKLWQIWCQGILSAAKVFTSFKNVSELLKIFNDFQKNNWTKAALPIILAKEIKGFGFALSCDFLKEIGYDYPKPDVHIKEVMHAVSGVSNEFDIYKEIIAYAKKAKTTAFKLDKIIWLICSGKFYLDNVEVKGRRDDFINTLKEK